MRTSGLTKKTNDRKISLSLGLDGSGKVSVSTGNKQLDSLLVLFGKSSNFDLYITCDKKSDIALLPLVQDVGSLLGKAFAESLDDGFDITRFADVCIPVGSVLMKCAVDIYGDSSFIYDVSFSKEKISDFDTELFEIFFSRFVHSSGITLHFHKEYGENAYHIAESLWISFAVALKRAVDGGMYLKGDISAKY